MHGLDTSNVSSRVESSRAKWNLSYTGEIRLSDIILIKKREKVRSSLLNFNIKDGLGVDFLSC